MNTNQRSTRRKADDKAEKPIVFHLRRYRFWHGEHRLRQAELAALAGVSTRQLREYESSTRLPRCVATLLAAAIALNLTIEDLVARHVLDSIKARINDNRALLEAKHKQKRSRQRP